jgi:TatD DNase family protein
MIHLAEMSIETFLWDAHSHSERPDAITALELLDDQKLPHSFFTIGIHPWNISRWCALDLSAQHHLWQKLKQTAQHPLCVGIGECGLDGVRKDFFEQQVQLFRSHLELARSINLPLVIHNVRMGHQMAQLTKYFSQSPLIFHDCQMSEEELRAFAKRDHTFFSFHRALLRKETPPALKICPKERLLIESDDSSLRFFELLEKLTLHRPELSFDAWKNQIISNISLAYPKSIIGPA